MSLKSADDRQFFSIRLVAQLLQSNSISSYKIASRGAQHSTPFPLNFIIDIDQHGWTSLNILPFHRCNVQSISPIISPSRHSQTRTMHFSAPLLLFALSFLLKVSNLNADDGFQRKKTHLNKDPRDYNDRDLDSLFDEWEVSRNRNRWRLLFRPSI